MNKHVLSQAYLREASLVTPGASQTRSKAPGGIHPVEDYPVALNHGWGSLVWDVDGNRYVDLICALAATTLGYNHPAVQSAVLAAVNSGPLLSLPTLIEERVSRKLCDLIGCDMVRWVKTGSEAMSAAVKLARAKTRRAHVLVAAHSYHGWHDWFQAHVGGLVAHDEKPPGYAYQPDVALPNGVPVVDMMVIGYYDNNNIGHIEEAVAQHSPAAIILEPHRQEHTDPEFVKGLREIADREGCALIFDDMIYGFRWHEQGSRGHFGVEPDLQVFGKALGAGYPVACVTGKREWMEDAGIISSTYGGDRIGLAAAEAVIDMHLDRGAEIIRKLHDIGEALVNGVNGGSDPDAILTGFHVHPTFNMQGDGAMHFLSALARQGVLAHNANWNINLALEPHIDEVIAATRAALEGVEAI